MDPFPPNFVQALPIDTFATINTQPKNMPSEQWLKIVMFHLVIYFTDFLDYALKTTFFLGKSAGK